MAFDLSKVDPKSGSIPDPAFNRETTAPRVSTQRPDLEVNAKIVRPDMTGADQLAKLLGVAVDVASTAFDQHQQRLNQKDAAAAELDFSTGSSNPEAFKNSRAYRDAWQLQGVKKMAVDISAEVTDKVNARLNDADHPALPADIDAIIEGIFKEHTTDPQGKVLSFGTPEATMTLANALAETRARIIPAALTAIKQQQDTRFTSTWADNAITEYNRGAEIGAVHTHDPSAPLPIAPTSSLVPTAQSTSVAAGTRVQPFSGFAGLKPTSVMGAPRQGGSSHNGEDYPVPSGTPLVAPLGGTVIASFSDARGGNQIRVRMADGAIIGYAHLSERKVSVGTPVSAGEVVGLSGSTGDATGPHVHMTVEVNGQKVSPKHYFSSAAPSGLAPPPTTTGTNEVALVSTPDPHGGAPALPPFDFERAMKQLPPSIDKGEAKKFLLQTIINKASQTNDIGILTGLEDSRRGDGTPSFTPAESAVILKAREEIADKAVVDADRTRRQLWQQNGDALLTAMVSNQPPSDDFIARAAADGKIDPSTAYTLIEHNKAARHQADAEARFETRTATAEADGNYDAFVAGEAARLTVGDLSGTSPDVLFQSGKLGPPGKKALGRYRQLQAAEKAGEERNRENPLYGQYMGQLRLQYGGSQANPFLAPQFNITPNGASKINYYGMTAFYKLKVSKGMDPEEAYLATVEKFGPPTDAAAARRKLLAELRAKKAAAQ